jgi:hypothetical protein
MSPPPEPYEYLSVSLSKNVLLFEGMTNMASVFRSCKHSYNDLPAYCFLFIFARNEKSMDKKNEIIVKDVAIFASPI